MYLHFLLTMTIQQFREITSPHSKWPAHLKALWYDAQGQWETAHDIIDSISGREAAWVHAYLHRKEGDNWNANYWYRRANRSMPLMPLEQEWEVITAHFIVRER